MTQYPIQLAAIEAHLRRRLRSRIVSQQKRKSHLFDHLVKRGISRKQAASTVYTNRGRWSLSNSFALTKAYPNRWFIQTMGQKVRSDQQLPNWFSLRTWIKWT